MAIIDNQLFTQTNPSGSSLRTDHAEQHTALNNETNSIEDTIVQGFVREAATVTYVSDSSFTVSGNVTAIYTPGRIVRFSNGALGIVSSSSYSDSDSNTTVNIVSGTVPSTLSYVDIAIQPKGGTNKIVDVGTAQTITGVKTFSSGIKTDTIDEKTTNAGVTIDGLLIKDGTFVFPTCKAIKATNYTLASGSDVALPFDGEEWDTNNMHDTSTNPSRITVPSGGYYFVSGVARFASSTTGGRQVAITVNGGITYIQNKRGGTVGAGGTDEVPIAGVVKCNANDYIELHVYQDTGGNLTVYANSHLIVAKLF